MFEVCRLLRRTSVGRAWRLVGFAAVLVLVTVTALGFVPSPSGVRGWAESLGPSFVVLFLLIHALVTVAPLPRSAFSLSAGLLLGPALGVVVCVVASALSAALAMLLVRGMGRDLASGWLRHRTLRAVDARLEQRGWLAVASLRLIPGMPFAVVNYCCGLSSVRFAPFMLATVVGLVPGTISVVLLGATVAGRGSPVVLLISGCSAAVGMIGVALDLLTPRAADVAR